MDIAIHSRFLPHNDPAASLAFYRDMLGFEVRAIRQAPWSASAKSAELRLIVAPGSRHSAF